MEVNHTVPTFAYIVGDGSVTVIFAADSGPTERLWTLARWDWLRKKSVHLLLRLLILPGH